MEVAGSLLLDVVNRFCSWIPVRAEPPPMSRDFWMPDESCRVCYECDSPFTLFNRRHHCRICGRIFCGKCTLNTLPGIDCRPGIYEDGERVRVCNFCFKIKQEEARKEEEQKVVKPSSPTITPSSSSFSLASSSTSGSSTTSSSSSSSVNTAQIPASYGYRTSTTTRMDSNLEKKHRRVSHTGRSSRRPLSPRRRDPSPNPYDFCSNRSDDDETDNQKVAVHHDKGILDGQMQDEEEDDSCVEAELPDANNGKYHQNLEYMVVKINSADDDNKQNQDLALKLDSTPVVERSLSKRSAMSSDDYDGLEESMDESNLYTPSLFQESMPTAGEELVDVENNDLIWVPPPPEDEDDEMGLGLVDDDDDDVGWGSLSSSEYRSREKAAASDEQRRAMRAVVDGHFRALVGQLLDGEGLEVEESEKEGWLGIVSALALQAASLIKPDTSKDGGMDPGGYVKVKCIAAGHRSESRVVKGIVCKKNVAHRRMTPRFKNPRILLLGGALEYQRVSNQLSSLDTLLQQEKDHISMIVARIEAHHPNVVLVEKNVSGQAQEWLLAKGISLVQNVCRPLLERIARCTGAEIVPSSDHLLKSICGHCELFFVEKFVEDLGTSGQGGKKSPKTLMFYEGCPRPLGCTVLLKGASEDELKKVKRVVQYAVFAAYQLALETSFLVDEGATLPELPFKSPISVALPDKQSKFDKSITTVPGFLLSGQTPIRESQVQQNQIVDTHSTLPVSAINIRRWTDASLKMSSSSIWSVTSSCVSSRTNSPNTSPRAGDYHDSGFGRKHFSANNLALNVPGRPITNFPTPTQPKVFGPPHSNISDPSLSPSKVFMQPNSVFFVPGENSMHPARGEYSNVQRSLQYMDGNLSETTQSGVFSRSSTPLLEEVDGTGMVGLHKVESDVSIVQGSQFAASGEAENNITWEDNDANHEEFPPSPSDHQSILVSFSSSCLRKGMVCERGLLFRIKYYGSFDKPLGKFLRDNVFDLSNVCGFCEETRDAHLHCYMHRQGSLTISVHRQKQVLPGERDGKIWMWHRCLKCPRLNGVPPSTHRVLMSDAAWGLSFGKFLELSFSNHAAASRLAACGHSLHRDCLRFYGFGSMVACFRYAPINVHSVFLPPSMLEFNNPDLNEWLRNEVREVTDRGKLMFAEAFNTLRQIEEKVSSYGSAKAPEARRRIAEFESLLINDQKSFVEALQMVAPSKREPGSLYADILELNSTRRSLAVLSTIWHKRFLHLLAFLRLQKSTPISRSANLDDPSTLFSKTDIVTELGRTDDNAKELCNGSAQDASDRINMVQVEGGEISNESHNGIMPQSDQVSIHTPNDFRPDDGNKLGPSDSGSHYAVNISSAVDQSLGNGIPVAPKMSVGDATATTLSPSSSNLSLTKQIDSTNKLVEEKDSFQFHVPDDDLLVRRTLSEGQFPILPPDLPDTYETVWTGKGHSVEAHTVNITSSGQEIVSHGSASDLGGASEDPSKLSNVRSVEAISETTEQKPGLRSLNSFQEMSGSDCDPMVSSSVTIPAKTGEMLEGFGSWSGTPFSTLYRSYSKGSQNGSAGSPPTMGSPLLYNSSTMLLPGREARVLLPIGIGDTVIPVYDDEPTSVIAYAITSHQYQDHLLDRSPEKEKPKEKEEVETKREAAKGKDTDVTTTEDVVSHPLQFVEGSFEHGDATTKNRSAHIDENPQARIKESGHSQYFKATHVKVSFSDDGAPGKVKYTVTCYYAKQFDALRKKCCPNQMEFIRSLCRCKKWGAQGGKSNVFFAKTGDDRFVIKQVTKTELESFIKFAPQYFKYLSDALTSGSPTCLAKILGIFQVTIKHGKNGREVRMDLMAMENLLYGRHVTRLYDLKGSLRSRYNADVTGTNKVLLDQNLLESMLTNPIFIGNKAKRILERAVWNDTSFLASVDVMDYSLLVGVDEERRELVLGIIDFMRQYTWDKHLETWVKASGILGGPKNAPPTVISPKQYKKRFRKAMKNYFLMVPDQWSPPTEIFGSSRVDSTSNESATAVKEQVSDEKVM